jgi:precorrin-2/cobalt-factor-2 C20-methyltransferase
MPKVIAYGVGVGPGDPELLTLKAVRLIKENEVIALPGESPKETLAYRIAVGAVPELAEKELLGLAMPMLKDREALKKAWRAGAETVESFLDAGRNVIFLTLGDPTVYSTFSYLQKILEEDGYRTETVSGVTSFCAAAARANRPLAEWDEVLHILPGRYETGENLEFGGNYVLMKSGSHAVEIKEKLQARGLRAFAVENCGLENEKVYERLEDIPEDAGYFLLIVAKE